MSRRGILSRTLLVAGALLALAASPATAQGARGGFDITAFDVRIDVDPSGTLRVREQITVDYGFQQFRGIFRYIPVVYDLPSDTPLEIPDGGSPDEYARVLEIDDIEVTSGTGAPTELLVERPRADRPRLNTETDPYNLYIRIGEENTFISGVHQYTILYTVRGAFNEFDSHAELYWNVTGNDWLVPIHVASAQVVGSAVDAITCFAGTSGATSPCTQSEIDETGARFRTDGLAIGEGLTIVVAFEPDAVSATNPILVKRWTFVDALGGSAAAIPLSVATSILAFGGVALLLWRQGRDRVAVGGATSHGTINPGRAIERRLGMFEPRPVPVQFRPPDDLRPGELGLIVDETVDPIDISATIVDLAVGGFLRIEEIETGLVWKKADWRLSRMDPPGQPRELKGYERRLYEGLFATGDPIRVSDLKGSFARDYQAAERMLYAAGVSRGWFRRSPDKVRSTWLGLGIVSLLGSIGVFVLGVLFTTFAAAAMPLILGSMALAVGHRHMPHRTGKGSDLLIRTLGFKEFIGRAEAEQLEFAERENIFVEYLPFAVTFGLTDKWAQAFADVGVDVEANVGRFYTSPYPFAIHHFAHGMTSFGHDVGTSLATVPASSGSGGFSGFGGGGGGSGGGVGGGGGGGW